MMSFNGSSTENDDSQAVAEFEKHKSAEEIGQMDDFGGMEGTLCVIGIHSGGDKIYVPERAGARFFIQNPSFFIQNPSFEIQIATSCFFAV